MKLLLDSVAIVVLMEGRRRMTVACRRALADPDNERYLSDVSCWELAIKTGLGKLKFDILLPEVIEQQSKLMALLPLPITRAHVLGVQDLPLHHRDPFDRLLVAQARAERMTIVSNDPNIPHYGVPVIW